MQTRTVHIPIKHWFPHQDPIAILVVKLCILREDFLLALAGEIEGEKFTLESKPKYGDFKVGLDANSEGWRRAYFFRSALTTLHELKNDVEAFSKDKTLIPFLNKESAPFKDAFNTLRGELATAERTVTRIRHNVGAHIDRGEIENVLHNMSDNTKGLFQDSQYAGIRRYKFVTDIVIRMFVPDVAESDQARKLEELLKEMTELIPIFRTIDSVVAAYLHDRNLTAC